MNKTSLESIRQHVEIAIEEIAEMSYVQILALLAESNRPPGGNLAVSEYIARLGLNSSTKALHAGCNAGFLTREMHRRTSATIIGIDISPEMVEAANERALNENYFPNVVHRVEDMRKMSFKDEYFDTTFSGGALAFVDDHTSAINEWTRVTKSGGMLGEIALYYSSTPPTGVIEKVEDIIKVKIPQYSSQYWQSLFFDHECVEPYYVKEIETGEKSDDEVRKYCVDIVDYSLPLWNSSAREFLVKRLEDVFLAFNENMKYLDAVVILGKKIPSISEPALYA